MITPRIRNAREQDHGNQIFFPGRLFGFLPEALRYVERDEADLVLQIPVGFEKQLVKEDKSTMFMALNAINGVKANLGGAHLQRIIGEFNQGCKNGMDSSPALYAATNRADKFAQLV